jgi:hypothetical protein
MNELHPKSARYRTMSRFSSSKGHRLDEELCASLQCVHGASRRYLVLSVMLTVGLTQSFGQARVKHLRKSADAAGPPPIVHQPE